MTDTLHEERFAEAVVAACAAGSRYGAELAHQRLTADQFASNVYAAIFTAARDLPSWPMPTLEQATDWERARLAGDNPVTIWPSELRLHDLARRLDIPIAHLEQLLDVRPVADDTAGAFAATISAAAARRRLSDDTVELHELVRVGDHQRAATIAARITQHLQATG